jgi:hypothetical protein
MVSWLWAFYCFDYKWSLTNYPLESRIRFFEENWPFMAGKTKLPVLLSLVKSAVVGDWSNLCIVAEKERRILCQLANSTVSHVFN